MSTRTRIQQILYGSTFSLLVPAMLWVWAYYTEPQIHHSVPFAPMFGLVVGVLGAALMLWSMLALRIYGGGLPMNAFPPEHYVARGPYALFAHPIYVGFAAIVFGASIYFESPSGFWLVTPAAIAGCIALVLGYEADAIERLFGKRFVQPLVHIPSRVAMQADRTDRISSFILTALPYLLCSWLLNDLVQDRYRQIGIVVYLAFMLRFSVSIETREGLRRYIQEFWTLMVLDLLLRSVVTDATPVLLSVGLWLVLRSSEGFGIVRVAQAFLLAALIYFIAEDGATLRDLAISAVFGFCSAYAHTIWSLFLRASERVANSWHDWRIGRVRLINHGMYTGLGSVVGILIMSAFTEPRLRPVIVLFGFVIIIGAGIWAQFLEGSSKLSRPYGFYGGIFAAGAFSPLALLFGLSPWYLLACLGLAGPWIQAFGRLRCMVQGCCHGAPTDADHGIVFTHPMSRVVTLSHLAEVPLYPTQLYSIVWNIISGILVAASWIDGQSCSFVLGMYLLLNGIGRFVEEARRGEAQTKLLWGMRVYQWLAISTVLMGIIFSCIPSEPTPPSYPLDGMSVVLAVLFGLVTWFAHGVDFPQAKRRFARLA